MRALDYEEAHNVVEAYTDLYWDGWDIVSWVRNPNGATNTRGEFRGGWGISKRFPLRTDGSWRLPDKYA